MTQITLAFAAGLVFGVGIALTWALHLMERRARRYKEAAVVLQVTPELAARVNQGIVEEWLNQRGLVWVPKGREFVWPGEVKKT